jgi:hypothetical protein
LTPWRRTYDSKPIHRPFAARIAGKGAQFLSVTSKIVRPWLPKRQPAQQEMQVGIGGAARAPAPDQLFPSIAPFASQRAIVLGGPGRQQDRREAQSQQRAITAEPRRRHQPVLLVGLHEFAQPGSRIVQQPGGS